MNDNLPILLIDGHNLAWRMHHAIPGELTHKGKPVNVIFGFLRELMYLRGVFGRGTTAFCFDYGKSLRLEKYPAYKADRHDNDDPVDREARANVRKQIGRLIEKILPDLGFQNIFAKDGYEADDIIASLCNTIEKDQQVIISSTDKDLWQLLSRNVSIWNPITKKQFDRFAFQSMYGVDPIFWRRVKALMGDKGDNISGIPGVGEKTALKYLLGELKRDSKIYQTIRKNFEIVVRNLDLVKLPYPGTPSYKLKEDSCKPKVWDEVVTSLGMDSLKTQNGFGV